MSISPCVQSSFPQSTSQQQPQQQQEDNPHRKFDLAFYYFEKVKARFPDEPYICKQFLEILHTLQNQQCLITNGISIGRTKLLTQSQVYQPVTNLFKHHKDLLTDFGVYSPDGKNCSYYETKSSHK